MKIVALSLKKPSSNLYKVVEKCVPLHHMVNPKVKNNHINHSNTIVVTILKTFL